MSQKNTLGLKLVAGIKDYTKIKDIVLLLIHSKGSGRAFEMQ